MSLARLGISEAVGDVKKCGQRSAPPNMYGPVPGFNSAGTVHGSAASSNKWMYQ